MYSLYNGIIESFLVARKQLHLMDIRRVFISAAIMAFFVSFASSAQAGSLSEPPGIADGPGIWMNIWSHPPVSETEEYCLNLNRHGVRNVFVQTSRSNTEAIRNPDRLGKLIETCHRYKIRVIAWSFSMLDNPEADAQKMVDAAQFRTPKGDKFDSIAANMEKDLSAWKVEKYSRYLRDKLGKDYPLVAVVFSPLNKAPQVARTPWKMLDHYYDVIAPMNYWNSKYADYKAYDYTRDTVKKVRELIGRPDAEIHVIGDGMKTHSKEIHDFMRACRDNGVTSASLYPFHQVTDEQYDCLARYTDYFPVNARFSLAAFKELRKQGEFVAVKDPSSNVSRNEFYSIISRKLTGTEIHDSNALADFVRNFGLDPACSAASGNEVIGQKEALDVIARAVDLKARARKMGAPIDPHNPGQLARRARSRADKWFVPSARAAIVSHNNAGSHDRLNYLEAARIILSADSALR